MTRPNSPSPEPVANMKSGDSPAQSLSSGALTAEELEYLQGRLPPPFADGRQDRFSVIADKLRKMELEAIARRADLAAASPSIQSSPPAKGRNPTDAERIAALEWFVRDAQPRDVWIAQRDGCLIGVGRNRRIVEGDDLTNALDALVALQEDTADVE